MKTHRKTCSAVCFAFQTASKPAVSIRHPSEDIMSLKTRLTEDMKTAMRAKDQVSLGTIRLINAAVKQFEVDERTEADDAKITAILTKMVKQRKDGAKSTLKPAVRIWQTKKTPKSTCCTATCRKCSPPAKSAPPSKQPLPKPARQVWRIWAK